MGKIPSASVLDLWSSNRRLKNESRRVVRITVEKYQVSNLNKLPLRNMVHMRNMMKTIQRRPKVQLLGINKLKKTVGVDQEWSMNSASASKDQDSSPPIFGESVDTPTNEERTEPAYSDKIVEPPAKKLKTSSSDSEKPREDDIDIEVS